MAFSAFQKLQFGLIGLLGVGSAVFYVGFWAPFGGQHTTVGSVRDTQAFDISVVKGGQTLNTYPAIEYTIALDGQTEPAVYQEPSSKPSFANGQRVNVTWAKRGLFGKPLVYAVK